MVHIFAKWIFENEEVARKAVKTELLDGCASSWGEGEDQDVGFDTYEKDLTYTAKGSFCEVTWAINFDYEELNDEHWMSPYLFEDFDTFDENGKSLRGEATDFGLSNKEVVI